MDRAIKIVRAIFPAAKPEYLAAFEAGDAKLATAGIMTPLRLAHLLAQCGAETGGLKVARESLMYTTEARLHSGACVPPEAILRLIGVIVSGNGQLVVVAPDLEVKVEVSTRREQPHDISTER